MSGVPITLLTSGALVIPLDPEAQSPSQALLLALVTAIVSMDNETVATISEDISTGVRHQQESPECFGPYFAVTVMAWAAFQEIRSEYRLVMQQQD